MLKTIILLTKSRKHGGYCTAGIDVKTGEWIRIVSDCDRCNTDEITSEQLSYENGQEAEVLDVIEIHCIAPKPNKFQPENYVNDNTQYWQKIRKANLDEVIQLHPFENKEYIYFDNDFRIEGSSVAEIRDEDKYSLILIKVTNPIVVVKTWPEGDKSATLNFCYNKQNYKYFRITNGLEAEYKAKADGNYIIRGEVGLIISLGELYKDFNHYKLIAEAFNL